MKALILTIGGFFAVLASLMAFVTTFAEYTHHYRDKRRPFIESCQTAIFTFIIFAILTLLTAWLLGNTFGLS
jgi:H+/Cl- antiporter ClcA